MKKTRLSFAINILKRFIETIIPFCIPFIFDIPENILPKSGQWILCAFVATIEIIFLIVFLVSDISKKKEDKLEDTKKINNESIRQAYSHIYRITSEKSIYLQKRSYNQKFSLSKENIPYDVHDCIREICCTFMDTIANITNIHKENISVTFIYKYKFDGATDEEKSWKWCCGKEATSNSDLDKYINEHPDSVYYKLSNDIATAYFCNDKAEEKAAGNYNMSTRDKRHGEIGSYFASRIAFTNNTTINPFCEGIIMVSSYGKKFVESNEESEINNLRKLIIDTIFPCYQRMLEVELGLLYFKHEKQANVAKEMVSIQ